MSLSLHTLMEARRLPALACYFARFVARGAAVAADGPVALAAALVSARNLEGDVCVDLDEHAGTRLFPGEDGATDGPMAPPLDDWLAALAACPWVGTPEAATPLVLDGTRLYLGKYWRFEADVAAALSARMQPAIGIETGLDRAALADWLGRLFPSDPSEQDPDWQRIAAAIAVTRRFAVISGGPGTGKTTTVVKVLALLLALDPELRIALAAPTGKAAARLTESIGTGKGRIAAGGIDGALLARIPEQAETIHRLLGFMGHAGTDGAFRRNADNPLPVDCLVVDEASMVDLPLMARLLAALPGSARLVLLGDRDQLASVEAGNVLGDITGLGRPIHYHAEQLALLAELGAPLPALGASAAAADGAAEPPPAAAAVALLRKSWRFGADSGIGALARAVNAGDADAATALLGAGAQSDLARLLPVGDALNPGCIDWAAAQFAKVPDAAAPELALTLLEQARVLAALHRGPFGVEALNARIAARLGELGKADGGEAYHGLPIMVTANDYEVGLFNGDVGLLWRGADGRLAAHFRTADGTLRSLSVRQLPPHVPAYALTVHKSQGSEFDRVLLVLPPEPHPLASRELVYTGVTRARRHVTVHATDAVLRHACRARVKRGSALAERLGWPA
jgi:exodeoxyribonuclease V alpha subunit